jgi:CheY-like chemotaxis protein
MADDREPIEILLAEDNLGNARLTEKAFKKENVLNNLHVVEDGFRALECLRREDPYADAPRPDLVLLDLQMPRKDGWEVLKELNGAPDLGRIPVVVLTSSEAEEDIVKSYELNANAYMTKPVGFEGLIEVVRSFKEFWVSVVKLPPK